MSRKAKHKGINKGSSLVSNFQHLSDSVVYYVRNNETVFYNIEKNIVFNPWFSVIADFNNLGYALATIIITVNDKKYYIVGYVNELGEIVSPLVNTFNYKMEKVLDLDTYLTSLTQKIENINCIKLTKNLLY